MLNSEAWELLVQGYEAAHDAKGIAKAYSGRKWMVYRLAEQKRKTGGVRPGDIVVMDNMRSHHVKAVREILGAKGMKVLYLPPYSPDGSQELCANKQHTLIELKSASNGGVLKRGLQVLHIHVLLVGPLGASYMAEPGADQHQCRVAAAHHSGAAANLPVEPFNDIISADASPVFAGKVAVSQCLFNPILDFLGSLFYSNHQKI